MACVARRNRLDAGPETDRAAAGSNVIAGGVVELGQWRGGDTHAASFCGLHRLAHDLRSVWNRDAIEVFAQRTYQNWLPETVDGGNGLSVILKPFLKIAFVGM